MWTTSSTRVSPAVRPAVWTIRIFKASLLGGINTDCLAATVLERRPEIFKYINSFPRSSRFTRHIYAFNQFTNATKSVAFNPYNCQLDISLGVAVFLSHLACLL